VRSGAAPLRGAAKCWAALRSASIAGSPRQLACHWPPARRAGQRFALGLSSLNGHQLAGEERFSVELHEDGSVW
jgi:hypothetical protein